VNEELAYNKKTLTTGVIVRISGPVVGVSGLEGVRLYDVVWVGEMGLVGEVIRLSGDQAIIQVYENTDGVRVGEHVQMSGSPLVAHLGPGLLGSVYDGLQRPLETLAKKSGYYLQRGLSASPLPDDIRWPFTARVSPGDRVRPGDLLGVVQESKTIEHRIMVAPGQGGRVVEIHNADFLVNDVVVAIEPEGNHHTANYEITLCQRWPVRQPRPVHARLPREARQLSRAVSAPAKPLLNIAWRAGQISMWLYTWAAVSGATK
jgi:V/A-type H+-transporting ATPase subunit A